jgi:glutamyl-tRNA synthetase/nondiscriminating glutamyl-tRNA synthetase
MKDVRVRYAPSPTGFLHIGGARSALFNYLFAKKYNGKFILRIEDTDVSRNVVGGEQGQLDYLKWLGITWDESVDIGGPYGPYRQLDRLELYRKYAIELLERGLAYKDTSKSEDKYAIRFKVNPEETFAFDDLFRGTLTFEGKNVEDWVILKENGIPTYNFAVVIDDHLMKISHVLRGEEHITNTPKQIMIYRAFGWDVPQFGHMTIIVNENRKKLSKRDLSIVQFMSEYDKLGYLPDAMFNFISLLGFAPPDNNEIHTKQEIIQLFDYKKMSCSPALFDTVKLAFINSVYIKKLDETTYLDKCYPYLKARNISFRNEESKIVFCKLFQDRLLCLSEIVKMYDTFINNEFSFKEEQDLLLKEYKSKEVISYYLALLDKSEESIDSFKSITKKTSLDLNIKGKELYMPLRLSFTAMEHGPSMESIMYILGKKEVIKRMKACLTHLKG